MTKVSLFEERFHGAHWMDPGAVFADPRHEKFAGEGNTIDTGASDAGAALALADAASAPMLLPAGATFLVGTDRTFTGKVVGAGGVLKPANGVTVTINGPFEAGIYQVFDTSLSGAGGVVFSQIPPEIPVEWFGAVGDGTTDDHAACTAARASLNGARGILRFQARTYEFSERFNVGRAKLIGIDPPGGSGGGGTVLSFPASSGLYSSLEDNFAYTAENLRIVGASARTANGFTGIDYTGCNYPRLRNVRIANFENGLNLATGAVVECHYGVFHGVQFDQCYRGAHFPDVAHSHKFYGGRFWDCVEGVRNVNAEDIVFFGSEFESDIPLVHPAAATTESPQTIFVGCREESDSNPSILSGYFAQIGDRWSGYGRAAAYSITSGAITVRNVASFGNNGDTLPIAQNLLRNPALVPSADNSTRPGWSIAGGTSAHRIGPFGRLVQITPSGATVTITQSGVRLLAGRYTAGFTIQRDSADGGFFSIRLRIRANGNTVTLLDNSNIAGAYRGGVYNATFDVGSDYDDVEFQVEIGAATGLTIYFGSPYIVAGTSGLRYAQVPESGRPNHESWSAAMPTTGNYRQDDYVHKTGRVVAGGAGSQYILKGWIRLTTGSGHVLNTDWAEDRALTGT